MHAELIDPDTGEALALEEGARGELVYTHLHHQAAPLLRFRSRDHVEVWTEPCPCGRTAPRVRCIGRTDDMLIVRGVNVFPTAVREVVSQFAPAVSGMIVVRPPERRQAGSTAAGGRGTRRRRGSETGVGRAHRTRIREALLVTTDIELAPWGTLPRSEYKSKLVDRAAATASHNPKP
jgi:phenylacetate-CoA ligase